MEKVIMLTQDNCPKCFALKSFLELGMKNKYADKIEVVKKEEAKEKFYDLVAKHQIISTPVLIYNDQVLTDTAPTKVMDFLEAVK